MIAEILDRVRRHESARSTLAAGGVLSVDRGLPYLLVHREPPDRPDDGTARLLAGEAAYLLARRGEESEVADLVGALARTGSETYGAFLVLELWSAADADATVFTVRAPAGPAPETVGKLVDSLEAVCALRPGLRVALEFSDDRHPPTLEPLLTIEESWQHEILLLGLEVPPIYRDAESGDVYPRFLRRLQQRLSRALRQALYEFVRIQTSCKVENHLALGTRTLPAATWQIDRALCAIDRSFEFLLLVSPVNSERAWRQFEQDRFARNPELHYRLLRIDPDVMKRRLFAIEMEAIDDPALADLYQDKREELDTQLSMLLERGASSFRYSSQRLYGAVSAELLASATELLGSIAPPRGGAAGWVGAEAFRDAALQELAYYAARHAGLTSRIEVRRDVIGLMVSEGNLLIGEALRLRPERVEPLLHHEVGTHMLTYANGQVQPLEQLSHGLAGYDELQEGLAVLAEYLAGGLDRSRMRLLAARVLAARSVEDRAEFVETFRLLRGHGYSARGAWEIALRVHACGGFTRDFIYLRGLVELLELLRQGAALSPLYVGKIAQKHVPIIEELRHREVLREPPLLPRFLEDRHALDRLDAVRRGLPLTEMVSP